MDDPDFMMAVELQKEFDREFDSDTEVDVKCKSTLKDKWKHRQKDLNSTCNLVHPEWETLDPTPDVNSMFTAFDNKFFQGRLKCVTLEWSKRMYSCAGICYSRRNRLGMAITIRLSEPLLKLRSRKDLVETLIHEMIHAYCSVLGIREGNGGHGPNFKKIMHGINKVAGTNITVYHTFHDEVSVYKTHWWRCNGSCQNRKPFLGYVKRTSNRAPGPNDIWWRQHMESCGGTFLKIREPEKKPTKVKKETSSKAKTTGKDIRKFFPTENKQPVSVKGNGGGTIVINDTTPWSSAKKESQIKSFNGVNNVIGFSDLTGSPSKPKPTSTVVSGNGYSLTSTSNASTTLVGNKIADRERIRDVWAKKFAQPDSSKRTCDNTAGTSKDNAGNDEKRRKIDLHTVNVPSKDEHWTAIDDEVMFKETSIAIIDLSSDDDEIIAQADITPYVPTTSKPIKQTQEQRQQQIKQEILDSSDCEETEDDIEIIDDDYNDDAVLGSSIELADTSLIDDLFGDDTLLRDFKKENSVISNSRYHSDPKNDIVTCPICQDKVTREQFAEHLDGCVGISIKILPSTSKSKTRPAANLAPKNVLRALKNAGYHDHEIKDIVGNDKRDKAPVNRRQGLNTSTHACPVCGREVEVEKINEHLDTCLPDE